jgi:hypothetical protein
MAQNFRQRENRNEDQKNSSNRNNIIRENKSLSRLAFNLRTWWPRRRFWFGGLERRDLQFRRRDRRNRGKRHGQRRNGLSCGSRDRDGIETRGDFGNTPAATGVTAERVARDVEKRLGKDIRADRVSLASGLHYGYVLRQCFDQGHPQRPDIGRRSERRSGGFRSVVNIESAR